MNATAIEAAVWFGLAAGAGIWFLISVIGKFGD